MCAIFGAIDFEKELLESNMFDNVRLMKHRGPDNSGSWISDNRKVFLGFNRLAIIDLSEEANQPFVSESKKHVLIFNGEIYNFKYIRKKLVSLGHKFRTSSDSEVLLKAYIQWDTGCLEMLEGMFSFAIYDLSKDIIFLARDRSGEKPLYYFTNKKKLVFASELKPLLNFVNLKDHESINLLAINALFERGYVGSDETPISNIKKLPAGNYFYLNISSKKYSVKEYWNLREKVKRSRPNESTKLSELSSTLKNLLDKSISEKLVADVPLGFLLSGGVDSSLITGLASRFRDKINTYTVIFPNFSEFDESKYARLISQSFKTDHHEIVADEISPKILDDMIYYFDEPFVDSSMIPTYLICKEISNSCKVAIGGDGGDELFGGYSHYNRFIQLQKLSKFIPYFFRKSLSQSLTKNINLAFKGKKSLEILGSNFNELNIDDANLFSYEMRKLLLFSDSDSRKITQEFKYIQDRDFVTNLCFKDYKNYLCEDILVKLDRASMASGLELRSPFLDSEIINFAFNKVPSKFKLTTTKRKILPKTLAKQVLPSNFDLSRKQGFSLPINKLFRTSDWKDYFYSNLIESNSRIFNGKYIESLFNSHQKGDDHGEKLFAILIFSLWYRKFITHSL